jgi:hypothetical protein
MNKPLGTLQQQPIGTPNQRPTGGVTIAGPLNSHQNAGLKKLGGRVGDIATEMFAPNSSSSTTNGKTVRSEFFGFWSQLSMSNSNEVKPFLDKLVDQVQLLDPQNTVNIQNGISPSSIINTIAFVLFCVISTPTLSSSVVNVDKLQNLHQLYSTGLQTLSLSQSQTNTTSLSIQDQNAIRFAQCVDNNTALKNLMRLIAIRILHAQTEKSLLNPQPLDIDSVLSPLVMYAAHIVPKDVRFVDWLRISTVDQADVQPAEIGFLYYFLTRVVQDQQRQNHANTEIILISILKAICDKCHSLPQQFRMSLPIAETSFLALLHMLRQFISMQAIRNIDFLEKVIRLIGTFRWVHFPIGHVAEQIIHLLKMEQISPGYNRRKQVWEESLVVSYQATPNSISTSPPPMVQQGILTQPTQYKHTKPIFYLYDSLDQSSLSMLNILDPSPFQQSHIVRPYITQADPSSGQYPPAAIIAQSLVHALDAVCPLTQAEVDSLCTLTLDKLAPIALRFEQLENNLFNLVIKGTFTFRERDVEYEKIKFELLEVARQNTANAVSFNLPQHYNLMNEYPGVYQNQYPAPPMPLIEHIRIPVELKNKTTEQEGVSHPGYPAVAMSEKLLQIINAYHPFADKTTVPPPAENGVIAVNVPNPKPRELRIVLLGNDKLVQHVVTAYFFLRSNYASHFNGLNIKFFLVPTIRNHIANYLAKLDLWYYRHIFTPFRSPFPFVLPYLRDDEIEVRSNHDGGLVGAPTNYFRECVVQYVRESSFTLRPIIYKLEGRVDVNSPEPSETIPFLQRVEIGFSPAVEEFRSKNGPAYAQMAVNEIQKDKNFIYSPPDLVVKYSKVDLVGQPKPEVVDDSIPYHSILISHVPRKGDLCATPDPTSIGLEIQAQLSKIDKAKIRKNSLYFEQRQHVAELTCLSQVSFKVVIDGVLHGPFRSIRITVAQTKSDGRIAHFPIQTFLPVQGQ